MQMSEIEREEILSSRAEERQKTVDRQAIRRMIQQRNDDGAGKSAKSALPLLPPLLSFLT